MSAKWKNASLYLTIAALVIFLASLPFNCIASYTSKHSMYGFSILLLGWLGPLVGTFAWYANLFFCYSTIRLLKGKTVVISPIIAVLLSLDTFRYTEILLNEGGATVPVYGYGWGAILWFLSLGVIWLAAGIRSAQEGSNGKATCFIAALFTVALVSATSYFYFYDRNNATPAEATRLKGIAFKRAAVCKEPTAMPTVTSVSVIGPLEIVGDPSKFGVDIFWDSPFFFLRHGQSIVRVGGLDYFWVDSRDSRELIAKMASSKPEAQLKIDSTFDKVNIELKLASEAKPVFSYHWEKQKNTRFTCPEIERNLQPSQLVLNALSLPEAEKHKIERWQHKNVQWSTLVPEFVENVPKNMLVGCKNIKLLPDFLKTHPEAQGLGVAVSEGDTIRFYPEIRSRYSQTFCDEQFVYMVHVPQGPRKEGAYITKILLANGAVDETIYVPFITEQVFMNAEALLEADNSLWLVIKGRHPTQLDKFAGIRIQLTPKPRITHSCVSKVISF